jgi:hypothetical protein
MTYKVDEQLAGYPPIEAAPIAAPAALNLLPLTPGFLVPAEDRVWGPGEFVFARANGAIRQYGLCVMTPVWDAANLCYTVNMTEAPNTANLGRPVFVAQAAGAMAAGQYGWFMSSGITPVNCAASVAADTAWGIGGAGQGGAVSAGKSILNSRIVTAATQTVIKAALRGAIGDTKIEVANTDGWFVGGYLSGAGVAAGATITSIDPLGKYVNASAVHTGALDGVNVTVTYNNAAIFYNVAVLNRAGAQGPIT